MPVSPVYARGLVRRDLEVLLRDEQAATTAVNAVIRREVEADSGRRMSAKRFGRLVRGFDEKFAPLVGTFQRAARRTAKRETYDASYAGGINATTMNTETGDAAYEQEGLAVRHSLLVNEQQGRRFGIMIWGGSSFVEAHALRRYVERDLGEACSPAALAETSRITSLHGNAYLRMVTAGLLPDVQAVVAPTARGAFVGWLSRGVAPAAVSLERDRSGLHYDDLIDPARSSLTVTWKTYLSDDLLSADQMKAVAQLRAAAGCLAPMSAQWRALTGCPVPEMIADAEHQAILESLRSFAEVIRRHDWRALFSSSPSVWASVSHRRASEDPILSTVRAQIWPPTMIHYNATNVWVGAADEGPSTKPTTRLNLGDLMPNLP